MQLKSLWIKDYKNLKDFSLDFEKGNGLSILIGNNGSGKSNVIEAISGIFADWHNILSPSFNTDYRIEYELDGKDIILERTDYKHYANGVALRDLTENSFLPSNVIALYSGEDSRLFDNFYSQRHNSYFKDVCKKGYAGKMGMYYVDKHLWNISILTLMLFMDNFPDVKDFLKTELDIKDENAIRSILIIIDKKEDENYEKNNNNILKAFIDKITPDGRSYGNPYCITALRDLISNSPDFFDAEPGEVFNLFMQALMSEFNLIKQIEIEFDNGKTLESLSEGEKKLILIKAILEFVADENSLLLLDEPDANIHEARKRKLYDLLRNTINRNVVMTTHSPIIAKMASEKELICLESKADIAEKIDPKKLDLIRKLASDEWNIMEAGVFLNSDKPLVLFEGKSDVDFVKRAIELLKEDNSIYEKIDVDFLSFNGTGNAKDFLKNIRTITKTKNVIFFFDRDDGGKKGMASIAEKSKDDETIVHFRDFYDDEKNIRAAFLPYPQEITECDFMIEDYFSKDLLVKIISKISKLSHPVTKLPKIGDKIKEVLASDYMKYKKSDFVGFKPLLDKLLEMLGENIN